MLQVSWTDLVPVCFGNGCWSGSIYPTHLTILCECLHSRSKSHRTRSPGEIAVSVVVQPKQQPTRLNAVVSDTGPDIKHTLNLQNWNFTLSCDVRKIAFNGLVLQNVLFVFSLREDGNWYNFKTTLWLNEMRHARSKAGDNRCFKSLCRIELIKGLLFLQDEQGREKTLVL